MMARSAILVFVLILGIAFVAACGSARRGAPVQPDVRLADSTLVRGQQVFMDYCNGCHPGGRGGLGLAINNKPLPAFLIRFQIRKGIGAMPGFSEEVISDEDVRAVARYLVALRHWD